MPTWVIKSNYLSKKKNNILVTSLGTHSYGYSGEIGELSEIHAGWLLFLSFFSAALVKYLRLGNLFLFLGFFLCAFFLYSSIL